MTDDPTETPSAPPAAGGETEPAEQTVLPTAVGYIVTCLFCGQRHEYAAVNVEPVLLDQGA